MQTSGAMRRENAKSYFYRHPREVGIQTRSDTEQCHCVDDGYRFAATTSYGRQFWIASLRSQ